ncbi:MAG: excinuclease ABC subunit UvrA [Candidatus Eisenbacteria bacterium]|uniref:UvrABC system protein A n=1 Tax=Eiseniibacteriota bacterium TaxID=2212470 RepID=A0A9D6L8J3_UNCEI|nr:excinuclease ABC subunit UvrA [Candidatus Eisenbacteria bacterium]
MSDPDPPLDGTIRIRGARQHNLKNLDLDLPRGRLTVITGVSGSGKSSLAFDTLYAEGQRRYVESVSSYAKQFLERLARPDVDSVHGLMPAVAIRQVAPARSARSTVGTATEIHDYLRLLFARLGTVHCASCGRPVAADSPQSIAREAEGWREGETLMVLAPVALAARLPWAEQAGHLMTAGYTRILIGGEATALEPLPKLAKGTRDVRIVIDRFTWRASDASRLIDSAEQAFRRGEGRLELVRGSAAPEKRSERWECSHCGAAAMRPEPALFSFNSPLGVCPTCRGFGDVLTFTADRIVPDPAKTLREGAIDPWARSFRKVFWPKLEKLAAAEKIPLDTPWRKLSAAHRRLLLEGGEGFRGAIPFLQRLQQKSYKAGNRFLVKRYQVALPCGACGGRRLRPEALQVTLGAAPQGGHAGAAPQGGRAAGRTIADVTAMSVDEATAYLAGLAFAPAEREIAGPVLAEIEARLGFMRRVDLGYLTLDRLARTLSGGEAQRIELANALGANLADTLYVLDEPTVGLHPRDTDRLATMLGELAGRGNTLVVVEHEPLLMRAAQHLVDLGPGAGEHGGRLLYSGPGGEAIARVETDTARYLRGEKRVERRRATMPPERYITVEGATHHNLRDVTARFPVARLTSVTGVSGSGKSSLIEDILYRAATQILGEPAEPPGAHRAIIGLAGVKRAALVDQSPIGKSPRSCPLSYLGAYAPLREVYARQPAAIARGLKDGAFSFNTPGGRCEHCEGAGWVTIEMVFLADMLVPCEMCGGDRFRRDVLDVRYHGVSIRGALDLTVDQAFEHFAREPRFTRRLMTLRRVGLGYLRLGQPAPQLSGGEAQRLKIARELSEKGASPALYVLDEPTVGLHFSDVQRLLDVLDDLVARGDTVVVVEHNLDVIRNSDWVVDLGPDGGEGGGRLIAEGPPEAIAAAAESWTGRFLAASSVSTAGKP